MIIIFLLQNQVVTEYCSQLLIKYKINKELVALPIKEIFLTLLF